jgi:hypothetical protein
MRAAVGRILDLKPAASRSSQLEAARAGSPASFSRRKRALAAGTKLAHQRVMAPRRASHAAIAAASDGSVLLNVVELVSDELRAHLSRQLGSLPVFIGIPLNEREAVEVVARLDGAAAEASAQLLGSRAQKRAKTRAKRGPQRGKRP